MAQLNVRLPDELLEKLRRRSERTGIPQSRVVRDALEEWMDLDDVPPLDPGRPAAPQVAEKQAEANKAHAAVIAAKHNLLPALLRCPAPGCDFTAPSPAAKCPAHGRTVR